MFRKTVSRREVPISSELLQSLPRAREIGQLHLRVLAREDDACLRPESNPRAVKTPSKWQTRQKIYRSSVARWRRYEPWLGPLSALVDEAPQSDADLARS